MMNWSLDIFTVTTEQAKFDMLRSVIGGTYRHVPAGTYTRLMRGKTVVMSDTPDELRDLLVFRRHATGRVLINGLGLGCALRMALEKSDVTHVDVVEIDAKLPELIRFFPGVMDDPRVSLHIADALTWRAPPGERWDVVWHDIWDYISADNLKAMKTLHRRYGRRAGWQGSWCRYECEHAR